MLIYLPLALAVCFSKRATLHGGGRYNSTLTKLLLEAVSTRPSPILDQLCNNITAPVFYLL